MLTSMMRTAAMLTALMLTVSAEELAEDDGMKDSDGNELVKSLTQLDGAKLADTAVTLWLKTFEADNSKLLKINPVYIRLLKVRACLYGRAHACMCVHGCKRERACPRECM